MTYYANIHGYAGELLETVEIGRQCFEDAEIEATQYANKVHGENWDHLFVNKK